MSVCVYCYYVYLYRYLNLLFIFDCFFFFKQKTAYEMRISDGSSDVCSSDLVKRRDEGRFAAGNGLQPHGLEHVARGNAKPHKKSSPHFCFCQALQCPPCEGQYHQSRRSEA